MNSRSLSSTYKTTKQQKKIQTNCKPMKLSVSTVTSIYESQLQSPNKHGMHKLRGKPFKPFYYIAQEQLEQFVFSL